MDRFMEFFKDEFFTKCHFLDVYCVTWTALNFLMK